MVDFRQRDISDNLNLISQGCIQDKTILGSRQKKMTLLLLANAGDVGLIPGSGRSSGGGNGNSPVFLPGKCHGWKSMAGYSPWGRRVSHDWAWTYTRGKKEMEHWILSAIQYILVQSRLRIECKCKHILDLALCLWMPHRESLAIGSALGNSARHAMQ